MTNETEMSAPKTLYEEPSWRYLTRRYVTLFWLGGTLVVLLGFVTAILSGYFLGFPRLGEYNYNLQSWVVLGLVGGGGSIVFASSLVSEVRLTRRASIQLDEIVLGRGGDDGWFRSLLGKSPGPARIAVGSVLRFRLETGHSPPTGGIVPGMRNSTSWMAMSSDWTLPSMGSSTRSPSRRSSSSPPT